MNDRQWVCVSEMHQPHEKKPSVQHRDEAEPGWTSLVYKTLGNSVFCLVNLYWLTTGCSHTILVEIHEGRECKALGRESCDIMEIPKHRHWLSINKKKTQKQDREFNDGRPKPQEVLKRQKTKIVYLGGEEGSVKHKEYSFFLRSVHQKISRGHL